MNYILIIFLFALGAPAFAEQNAAAWAEKISMGGDLRFRHDYYSKGKAADTSARHRERIRLRLNATAKITDSVTGKIRIATSDGAKPTSNNTTMSGNADKKEIYLDIAALDWKMCESGHAVIGKQENTLRLLPRSELIYDADYTPEGVSVNGGKNFLTRVGGFVVQERGPQNDGTSNPDSWLLAGVAAYRMELSESLIATAGGGYHSFTALKKNSAVGEGFLGNSSNSANEYVHDYQVGEILLELTWKLNGMNLNLYTDLIQNFGAEENNTGMHAGTALQTLGETGKPVWTFGYAYITTGKDATLSAANNSNPNIGIDGGFAHNVLVGRALTSNISTTLNYYRGQVDGNGNPFWIDRAMLDLIAGF